MTECMLALRRAASTLSSQQMFADVLSEDSSAFRLRQAAVWHFLALRHGAPRALRREEKWSQ